MNIRVGMGYDVHQLVEGRELWMGGIKLEHHLGLSLSTISDCWATAMPTC